MFNGVMCVAVAAGCVTALSASAQLVHRALGTVQEEIAYGLVANRDCGFAVTGSRVTSSTNPPSVVLCGLDASGAVVWTSQFRPLQGRSGGWSVQQTSDGGYIIGAEAAFGGNTLGKYLIRTNATGGHVWSSLYTGTPFVGTLGVGVGVRELADTSIVSVNRLQTAGVPSAGVFTRVQANGAVLVNNSYSFAGPASESSLDFADIREWRGVANPPGDNLFVVGHARENAAGAYVAFAARLDANGAITWARTYKHPSLNLTADGFCFTDEGDLIVSGRVGTGIAQVGTSDLLVMRVRAVDGSAVWSHIAAGGNVKFTNAPRAVEYLARNNEAVIAGMAEYTGPFVSRNAFAMVFQASTGVFLRAKNYGPAGITGINSGANALAIASPLGHVTLAGFTTDFGSGGNDMDFIRVNTSLDSACLQFGVIPNTAAFVPVVSAKQLIAAAGGVGTLTTLPGVPTINTVVSCIRARCVGDLNADSLVDDLDFAIFASAYNTLICPTSPAIACCPSDLNGDGVVDDADFAIFAPAYNSLLCP